MNTKVIIPIIILVLIVGVGFAWSKSRTSQQVSNIPDTFFMENQESVEVEDRTYTVVPEESTLGWEGTKTLVFNYRDTGTIDVREGSFTFESNTITSGEVIIDMDSIVAETTSNESQAFGRLTDHLKSDDFFSVSTYPTATFQITGMVENQMEGNLIIKNETHPITIPVSISTEENDTVLLSGIAIVDRTKWGVTFGSGSFFENLGDNVIGDTFTLGFKLILR